MTTSIIFPHIELSGVRYPRITIHWYDITGDSAWADKNDFADFTCSEVVTEGFLFDVFEKNGTKFIRTFASYIDEEDGPTFGDRGCFPVDILKPESRALIEMAELYTKKSTPDLSA